MFVHIGLKALLRLRTELYAYLQSLSLKYHDARRSSDSSFRVAYDSQAIQTMFNKGFTNIFASVVTLIGTFVVMIIDRLAAHVALARRRAADRWRRSTSSRTGSAPSRPRSRNRRARSSRRRRKDSARCGWCTPSGVRIGRCGSSNRTRSRACSANLRLTLTNVYSTLVISTLMAAGTAALYYVGSLHVLDGRSSLGSLLVFSAYLLMLYQPLESLTHTAWAMEGAAAGAQRCFEVLDRDG